MTFHKNNGDGTFTYMETVDAFALGSAPAAADVDGDGDNDLVYVYQNGTARSIQWYKNNAGVFAAKATLVSLTNTTHYTNIILSPVDVDNDGKIDLVKTWPDQNKVIWTRNLGNNIFGPQQVLTSTAYAVDGMAIADIDNNGTSDIVLASQDDDQLTWLKNNGTGYGSEIEISRTAHNAVIHTGDLDGDGDKDIVSVSVGDGKVSWFKNNGQGAITPADQIVIATLPVSWENTVTDVDGDGDLDIIVETASEVNSVETKSVVWFKNNGTANFTQNTIAAGATTYGDFYFVDVDSDGDIDVVEVKGNNFIIRKNNGNGTFTAPQSATLFTGTLLGLTFGDIDGDTKTDMVVTDYNGSRWLQNDGTGAFSNPQAISAQNTHSFFVHDLDKDGDNDLVFIRNGYYLGWFKNTDGQGEFGTEILIPAPTTYPRTIRVHDVDNDGYNDIIASFQSGYKLAWFKNDGQQNFSSAKEISSTTGLPVSIKVADMNADGKTDILTYGSEDYSINIFKNLGPFNNSITGTVRFDGDANGCTPADAAVPQVLVTTAEGSNTWATFTNADGSYTTQANQGTFTTTVTSNLPGFNATPQSHQSVFTENGGSTNTADFCLQANVNITDLEAAVYRLTDIRPGFAARYKVIVYNRGTMPVSVPLTLNFDNTKLNFNNAVPAAVSQASTSLTFDLGTMLPFQQKEFSLNFTAKTIPTISLGDEVVLSANASVAGDATPENNQTTDTAIVVGSYDPNDIAVREGSQILIENADEYLHYLIRFQNTGNYYAERVVVKNPIDSKLDWTTMQIESMSHNGRTEIINGAEATFTFDAIYLPAVTVNEPASHGYIAYKIKPKANVQLGDTFTEQAHIFFDFNPAIDTNIVTTTVVDAAAGLPQFTAETVSVYPVPSKNILNVKANSDIAKIEIYNQAGQRILSNASQNSIDISALSQGIYFAKIENVNGSSVTKKVVKN